MATQVNDIHGQLNLTTVTHLACPSSVEGVRRLLTRAKRDNLSVCVCGGRHAMGAQQFATDGLLIDTRRLNRVLDFDAERGVITVQGGIMWTELVAWLVREQMGRDHSWGIRQKQTGGDRMSIAGSLSANTHGRGLQMKPLVSDIVSFTLLDAEGQFQRCSRDENPELFSLAIGGYGMFGIITEVTLQLVPRQKIERIVRLIDVEELISRFTERIEEGFIYGDCQYMTDENADGYLKRGVFSCYRPIDDDAELPQGQKSLDAKKWKELVYLGHFNKAKAFQIYLDYYLSTDGQRYWSDTQQLANYWDDYHKAIDKRRNAADPATEVITEIFVPRDRLVDFLEVVRADFRENAVNVIYGTIRLVEQDTETFLPWARQSYVGVIFNLHTVHTPDGIEHSARAFRRLIDFAIARGGSYYLTYHKFATKAQVEACYPQFMEFLRLKKQYDPSERFQSDWFRHFRSLFLLRD